MILILSYENERTTDNVVSWLVKFKVPFFRVSSRDRINLQNITITNDTIDFEISFDKRGKTIKFSEISGYWYRRDDFIINRNIKKECLEKDSMKDYLGAFFDGELATYHQFLHSMLILKKGINSIFNNKTNKLFNLYKASLIGLKIPDTYVFNSHTKLNHLLQHTPELITKIVAQGAHIQSNNEFLQTLTLPINKDDLSLFDKKFFPTQFQKQIEKKFELRIFFIGGEFYSSAIFSQKNENTKVDFRNYDSSIPNRVVTYSLPSNIKSKLTVLMNELSMSSGSIDIVVNKDNEYVFLEVNPIGQFQQVSYPCNVFLEKRVAEYLKNQYNEYREKNKFTSNWSN